MKPIVELKKYTALFFLVILEVIFVYILLFLLSFALAENWTEGGTRCYRPLTITFNPITNKNQFAPVCQSALVNISKPTYFLLFLAVLIIFVIFNYTFRKRLNLKTILNSRLPRNNIDFYGKSNKIFLIVGFIMIALIIVFGYLFLNLNQ